MSTPTSSSPLRTAVAELAAVFTCNVCDHRSAKGFSRVAYERGVVIVTCEGCESMHVLADRLGWFGEPGDAQRFIEDKRRRNEERGDERGEGEGEGEGEEAASAATRVRSRAVKMASSSSSSSFSSSADSRRLGVLELMPEELEGWTRRREDK